MRKSILILFALSIFHASSAQDSTSISFSEETGDTLIKQRFIDRYENVFMTKVPTRQMFKIGYTDSDYRGGGFQLGYEYKIFPSFSIEALMYAQTRRLDSRVINLHRATINLWGQFRARWYYNMEKRIRKELNANNFSGMYIGAYFDHVFHSIGDESYNSRSSRQGNNRLGLLYGFQSRFFNRGFVDLAVGLFNWDTYGYAVTSTDHFFKRDELVLATQSSLGIAFGDWKRAKQAPVCDVLFCDEKIQGQWKLQIPDLVVGLKHQRAKAGLAYELKIGDSPLSLEADLNGWISRRKNYTYDVLSYYATGELQLRYYFMQKRQIRNARVGSNFSGPYAGTGVNYSFSGHESNVTDERYKIRDQYARVPLYLGYQQRLFGRIYIDGSLFYSRHLNSGANLVGNRYFFGSKLNIGFTF